MTWAQRLKRVFGIDIQTCAACSAAVRIIACIEDLEVIEKILAHLDRKTTDSPGWPRPAGRRRSAACSIHRDDLATTLYRLRRRWRGLEAGWASGRGGCEKCVDGRVAEANSGALTPPGDDQCAAVSAACACPRRRAAGACRRKGALFGLLSR